MYTKFGYRDGREWHIHHLDENIWNNTLSNLVYMKRIDHLKWRSLHRSEETRKKLSNFHKGKKWGKRSKEVCEKIGRAHKGRIWVTNGTISKMVDPNEIQDGFIIGRKLNK